MIPAVDTVIIERCAAERNYWRDLWRYYDGPPVEPGRCLIDVEIKRCCIG